MRARKGCKATGCPSKHYSGGYCKKHRTQIYRHGRLTPERERGQTRPCDAPDCPRSDTQRMGDHGVFCQRHRRQIVTHGRLTPEREHQMGNVGCKTPGCKGAHRAKGYCAKCWARSRWAQIKKTLSKYPALGAGQDVFLP